MASQYVLARLENLYRKLDEEGWHVNANTVALAIEEIKRLQGEAPATPLNGALLPCPYCGCSNIRDFELFERRSHRIDCNHCNGGVTGLTRAEAVKKWNNRAGATR